MRKTVPAVYEDGVLRPLEPLDLPDRQRVTVTISEAPDDDDDVIDGEFHRRLDQMDIPEVSLEEVRDRLAKIPGSLTEDFSAEREERF